MRVRQAAAVAAGAVLMCAAAAVSPDELTGGAGNFPQCGVDERSVRNRIDEGMLCVIDEGLDALSEDCPEWYYGAFGYTETGSLNGMLICEAEANAVPCCTHYVFGSDIWSRSTVAYKRALPYSVTDVNTATRYCNGIDPKQDR